MRVGPEASFGGRAERSRHPFGNVAAVVFQVDATVSSIQGLAWLTDRRDATARTRLAEIEAQAAEEGWTPSEIARARLACLRPRRAELNALGRAYLDALSPGVIDAAHRIRRTGITVGLASDVAVEALFGVANALGVTPSEIHAPSVRFDALGAYAGSDVRVPMSTNGSPMVYVGTHRFTLFTHVATSTFVAFTGVVAQEGTAFAPSASVSTFSELATLISG